MLTVLDHLRASLLAHCYDRRGQRLLVAASGGADSMVLLQALIRLRPEFGYTLHVAHMNHGLRGAASDCDQQLVERIARAHDLGCEVQSADVKRFAGLKGLSLEMAGRFLRYQFLGAAAGELRCQTVVCAHHADDQAELFFLRLLRGAGGEGLGGMEMLSALPWHPRVKLFRPMLKIRKLELTSWARTQHIDFREDATNRSTEILRNRIRHRLLPALARDFGGSVVPSLVRTMDILATETEYVIGEARKWITGNRPKPFGQLHVAVQRQVIRIQLLDLGVVANFSQVEHFRSPKAGALMLSPACIAVRDSEGRIRCLPPQPMGPRSSNLSAVARLDGHAGLIDFVGLRFRWRRIKRLSIRHLRRRTRAGAEIVDGDQLGNEVRLRFWQPGDRFRPLGMDKASKLQDIFTNRKVPAGERGRRVIVTDSTGEIAWVEGLPLGDCVKITSKTRSFLLWQWSRGAKATPEDGKAADDSIV